MPKNSSPEGPRPRRRRRSAEVARQEILDAAQKRLSEGGPDAIRLQEIARDVGIAHPTVLHHFGSRDGLIRALDQRAIQALTNDIARMIQDDEKPSAGVELVERLAQTMEEQGLARLIAWWAMRDIDPSDTSETPPAELVQEIAQLITARLREVGDFPEDTEEKVSFGVRLAVVAMFGDALIGDVMSPLEPNERERERHRFREWLVSTLAHGLSEEPPGLSVTIPGQEPQSPEPTRSTRHSR